MSGDVYVEHVEHQEWGLGEIIRVSLDTGDPVVSVKWPGGGRGLYWVEELEFLPIST